MLDLQIGIPCGPNSEYFANFLISTIETTISKSLSYNFLIGINKPGVNKKLIVDGHDESKFEFVEVLSDKNSSLGHAHCLNILLQNINSKFGIFLDSDVAMLGKDWDTTLLSNLSEKVVMIGSEYHQTDGKTINRPNVITCAFDAELLKNLKVDFTPSLKSIRTNEETSQYYGTTNGQTVMLDTGCEIMETLYRSKYETKTLKIVSPRYKDTINKLKVLDTRQRGEEYHHNNKPISTHIGRSLTRNFKNDPIVKSWKDCVEKWLYDEI